MDATLARPRPAEATAVGALVSEQASNVAPNLSR
jgi:hypothetical protein